MKELNLKEAFDILPKRSYNCHKGDFGTLFALVGSCFYRGAAQLCSLGALRTGVGILRVAADERVIVPLAAALPEATFFPLEADGGFDIADQLTLFPKTTAILCGCGITVGDIPKSRVLNIIEKSALPLVLDADGLNNINKEAFSFAASKDIIITPHIGEFSRLSGIAADIVIKNSFEYALEFAVKHSVTVVLKSCDTVIATPKGEGYISRYGNPGLARGGSGDILAGMIASFLAQGMSTTDAAVCGTLLHGAAADRCAKRLSMQAMLPHDILTDLCEIMKEEGR